MQWDECWALKTSTFDNLHFLNVPGGNFQVNKYPIHMVRSTAAKLFTFELTKSWHKPTTTAKITQGWLQGFQPTSLSLESRTSSVSSFPDSDSNYIMSPSRRVDSTKTGDRKLPSGEDRLQVSNRLGQLIIRIRIVQWPRWVGIRSPPVRPLLCYSH